MWRISRITLAIVLATAIALLAGVALLAQEEILHVSTQLVTVTVSVTDQNGRPISDMKRDEFTLLDDGRPREIQSLSQDLDVPLTLGLVADNSGSQRQFIEKHRNDLRQFIRQVLHDGDRAFLVSVPGPSVLLQDVTGSTNALETAIDGLPARRRRIRQEPFGGNCPQGVFPAKNCGTLIWNGVWGSAALRLRKMEGRKAILVLSDGQDTGSEHSLSSTIEAAQGADAPVYTIASEPLPIGIGVMIRNSLGSGHLKRLSEETGGGYFKATKNPASIFEQIEAELRHLYVLTFTLPEADRDGKFHKLQVKSTRAGVRIRARAGYLAQ